MSLEEHGPASMRLLRRLGSFSRASPRLLVDCAGWCTRVPAGAGIPRVGVSPLANLPAT